MTLSIITINRNNAPGLEKTMRSVLAQTFKEFEYVVIDGASTDGSVEVIKGLEPQFRGRLKWVSEPDSGIYNAMNKGIRMATGNYIQILNSGDIFASNIVTERMLAAAKDAGNPGIFYGNMIKQFPNGRVIKDYCKGGKEEWTMYDFIRGTVNHDPTYIRKDLYEKYGLYDETLKIVSDWKWFTNAVVFNGEKPVYTPIDVTIFDMTGISETNLASREEERNKELEKMLPAAVLSDYRKYYSDIDMTKRLHRHPLFYKIAWFMERVLFKIEKYKANA